MEKLTLSAKSRTLLGKQVKLLRQSGNLPANIYGKGLNSTSIEINEKDFRTIWRQAGETGIVYVSVDGEEATRPVLIHGVQKNPVTSSAYHVDLYQVNLKEKTTANVPVVLAGENELETRGEGLIIQTLSEIEVEALPADIPHQFEIDVTKLLEVGQTIKVGDLDYDHDKVEVKVDPEENILVMQTAEMKEVVEEVVEEVATGPEVISETEAEARAEGSEGEGVEAKAEEPSA